ncbi:MAG TPA: hypothetical protein VEA80_16940 [Vitreimonas sp.]|uniref:hypothetical protein n=1 Tax=Vitreimonas sp. TaxID=3069702 RepID=UPI002D624DA9|nr:hypothetical protein [Vitreimonas sp.]HYD89167.1 hypothetical protein [Vitreimonas sp.]
MAFFLVSYDAHKVRDYSRFYEAAEKNNGVALLESLWGFEFNSTAAQVRDWAKSLFDADDSVVVIELKPGSGWGTSKAAEAAAWLKAKISP